MELPDWISNAIAFSGLAIACLSFIHSKRTEEKQAIAALGQRRSEIHALAWRAKSSLQRQKSDYRAVQVEADLVGRADIVDHCESFLESLDRQISHVRELLKTLEDKIPDERNAGKNLIEVLDTAELELRHIDCEEDLTFLDEARIAIRLTSKSQRE